MIDDEALKKMKVEIEIREKDYTKSYQKLIQLKEKIGDTSEIKKLIILLNAFNNAVEKVSTLVINYREYTKALESREVKEL